MCLTENYESRLQYSKKKKKKNAMIPHNNSNVHWKLKKKVVNFMVGHHVVGCYFFVYNDRMDILWVHMTFWQSET